jgi:uncharacterized membrane protein YqjE
MHSPDRSTGGLIDSCRRLFVTLLAVAQNRVELFAVEVEEERERVLALLLVTALFVLFTTLAIVLLTLAIVWFVPAGFRGWTMLGFAGVYGSVAAWLLLGLRKSLAESERPFAQTTAELEKDLSWIKPSE